MSDIVERLRAPVMVTAHNASGTGFDRYEAEPSPNDVEAADEIERLRTYVEKLESRLETDCVWRLGSDGEMVRVEVPKAERPDEPHDGIFCRDETIKLQGEAITRLRSLLKEAGIAIERVTNFAEGQDWDIPPVSLEWEAAIQTLGSVLSKIKGEA